MYKIGSDGGRIIVGEYGRHLEGEYVRRRLRVKALGMEEIISVSDLAACRGEGGASMAYIEGRGGFGPFVDEGNDRVATLESLRAIGSSRKTDSSSVGECDVIQRTSDR